MYISITKEDILTFDEPTDYPKLFTEEQLNICRHNTITILRKDHKLLYEKYRKYNPDKIDFKKTNRVKTNWDEKQVLKVLSLYSTKGELLNNNSACYQIIHKRFRYLLPLYNKI